MSAYRFCRSDDVPLLVRAYNECFAAHETDPEPWSVDGFREAIRRLDLWTSSCMVATEGDRLIGVLLAAKREEEGENLIHTLGIHPEFRRQGHGRHLITSLGQKLAILGPPRILFEVPADRGEACAFVEACGYRRERIFTDFVLRESPPASAANPLIAPVTIDELLELGAIAPTPSRCWARARKSLLNRRGRARGLAIAGDSRIEAWVLYDEPPSHGELEILGCGCAREDRRGAMVSLLLRACLSDRDGPAVWRRVDSDEIERETLEACGFRATRQTIGYAVDAGAM